MTTATTVRRRAWTVGAVTLSLFCTFMTVGLAGASGTPVWNVALGFVLNVAAAIALIWRHDKPWLVLAMAVAGPLFFATDATAALIALHAVGAVAGGRRLGGAAAAVYLACAVSLTYDASRRRDYSVLTIGVKQVDGDPPPTWSLPWWLPLLVAAVLVAVVLGLSQLRRTKTDLDVAVQSRDKATAQSQRMHEDMLIQQERSRIARDMHDTLAAGLSRISLLAGGLQVGSNDGPEKISNTSALIRATAHDSLDELKRIIGVLRGSETGGADAGRRSLAGIGDLVDAARSAGCRVTLVQDIHPGVVGDLTSHTAYRIVQEALTNSQKHAPGAPLHITVSGADTNGISLTVRNHVPATMKPGPGSRSGLLGLTEQAHTAGGWVRWDMTGGEFVVTAWLPWYS
ncbi:histidine kinase [Rhodococcus sp. BP-149]|uniref:sensor histidine kinase n=1 Tax=unclassified Rhodococcus (in: high G+C Gram-positive bacteria) TaxID=192944 RepID=UPI001C9A9A40|nr:MULTISPECIES: histidine kinase [unclassified Rhodococcus (in: high G+C Gram-positive bacteria)]MBY6687207.1 histidine kinase [Rhodococcus sp. BP-288]MBY6694370.1 histidine kinase [Rhodococcus sp. BP-188]MBY6698079.1 histidine kinase [Rhodococcus sp. BP-285]MBY6704299.1 histidine kinase [Rhodococcus sp. BP-283]MBY6712948.1 histidine kinase [Rhodococcus sp. BP-160]